MDNSGQTAIALKIEDRFFHSFSKTGRLTTTWCLAGARLWMPNEIGEIDKIKRRLGDKNRNAECVTVEWHSKP